MPFHKDVVTNSNEKLLSWASSLARSVYVWICWGREENTGRTSCINFLFILLDVFFLLKFVFYPSNKTKKVWWWCEYRYIVTLISYFTSQHSKCEESFFFFLTLSAINLHSKIGKSWKVIRMEENARSTSKWLKVVSYKNICCFLYNCRNRFLCNLNTSLWIIVNTFVSDTFDFKWIEFNSVYGLSLWNFGSGPDKVGKEKQSVRD